MRMSCPASGVDGSAPAMAASTASRASSSIRVKAIWKPRDSRGRDSDRCRTRAAASWRRSAPSSGPTRTVRPWSRRRRSAMAWSISAGRLPSSLPMLSAASSSAGKWFARSWKKSRASSVGSRMRRPVGSAMPEASSRATRQARYSASTARAALGAEAARVVTSCSGTSSKPSIGSDRTSRRPDPSWRSAVPDRAASSTPSTSVSLMSNEAVTAR
jgi:hypothetical protein